MKNFSSVLFQKGTNHDSPFVLLNYLKGNPDFTYHTKTKVDKRTGEIKKRNIANPNQASRHLHNMFLDALKYAVLRLRNKSRVLHTLPSATAFKTGGGYMKNAERHIEGEHVFITDIRSAYEHVDLRLLSLLLVFIFHYEEYCDEVDISALLHSEAVRSELQADPLYTQMYDFLQVFFGGKFGQGLVFGGVASPYLFNLYMEAFVDGSVRSLLSGRRGDETITYTRYADDLVFSSLVYIGPDLRRKINRILERVGLSMNLRKTKVLKRSMGTVFITKTGIVRDESVLVYPKHKRKALKNRLHLFLHGDFRARDDEHNSMHILRGHIADFLGYVGMVKVPTKSDLSLLALCNKFQDEVGKRKSYP